MTARTSLHLGLFLAGAGCFLSSFLLPHSERSLIIVGGVAWTGAYLSLVADNYRKRTPVPTRGGTVTYEEKPRAYKFLYVFMAMLGLFFLLVFVLINVFRSN